MRGLFLNLPNNSRIMRRYMCSYNSPTFLFQPIELISLASIFRDFDNNEAFLMDSIAENLNPSEVLEKIYQINPDVIVSISGFECFEEDISELKRIKDNFPETKLVLFGYYPTQFPEITMDFSKVDYLIHGEPDLIFKDLINCFTGNIGIDQISGLSYREGGEVFHQKGHSRIPNPNELPMPAFDLLKNDLYKEPFFPTPFALLQSARGCPYQCNYCVKSYGTKLTMLTPENIIHQIDRNVELFNIRSFRFIDDTFTAVPKQVIAFCKLLLERKYNLVWSCLTRPDTMDKEMLDWMWKSGCKRLYIGIESGSDKVLEYYNKKVDLQSCSESLKYAKSLGFELMGLFMVGAPVEDRAELNKSISFAIDNDIDFVSVSELIPYPGTTLYEKLKNETNFSLIPYKNEFKDSDFEKRVSIFQKTFFRRFYLRPGFIFKVLTTKPKYLYQVIENFVKVSVYLLSNPFNRKRKDFI